jgi:hypothetical protein
MLYINYIVLFFKQTERYRKEDGKKKKKVVSAQTIAHKQDKLKVHTREKAA